MAAVIGREGRDIAAEDAPGYIAGYMVMNDWSARDLLAQRAGAQHGSGQGQGLRHLARPLARHARRTGGPRVSAPARTSATTWRCAAASTATTSPSDNTKTMYYTFPQMIERASEHVRLRPGDVIGSGTCGTGCILELGTERHRWLLAGDVVEMEIERLGMLRNTLIDARGKER